jgi:hypothetical protein
MTQRFVAQPYPLFAVTLVRADNPLGLALASQPIRLVLGWVEDDEGKVLPALEDSPSPVVWDGMLLYEVTRERAEATAKQLERADRAAARDTRILGFISRMDAALDRERAKF